MNWKTLKLGQLHIELSSHCNAACPNCQRFYKGTDLVRPDLKLNSITLDNFKKYFPKDIICNLEKILFCGTMGDPIMAKDCYEIFKYVHTINPKCFQRVHTNGGIRSEEFWSKMGKLFDHPRMELVWSIDGLEDTNHLYRRNVDWNVLMRNANAFINAGGRANWEWLIFGHNEHQVEQARQLATDIGFKNFSPKRAFGFDDPKNKLIKPMPVYNKQGELEYKIYPPKTAEYQNANDDSIFQDRDFKSVDLAEYVEAKEIKFFPKIKRKVEEFNNEKHIELGEYSKELSNKTIQCRSHIQFDTHQISEIYVSANGLMSPCCFVGTRLDSNIDYFIDHQLKSKINPIADLLDLNKRNIKEILESGILDQIFTDSWTKDSIQTGKMAYCAEVCGTNNAMDKLYI
jgi:MoaA/NifB/PqqE/SkfB family radical SAM enzyme